MKFEIEKDFTFEAAHYFDHHDANDVFKRVHGHSFAGRVTIVGDPQDDKGWIRDLWKIDKIIQDIVVSKLDHGLLNDVEGLPAPALEQIALWAYERLASHLPGLTCVEISRPSCGERARYTKS
ncbi:6-carboxytetrahydropterin synthase [Robiginitomaculum antarcticum]|uniref:6-carboxytetrahydropterin synthase n=1 Tax=Robiginitomaculum antarcticum TaxID=437507 RepID=UPI00036B83DE|nr:6-carboxytetrahydropterin synthase [Robiginitomaculum antarcticum]